MLQKLKNNRISSVTKKMCKNGRCVNSKFDCSLVSEACPDEDKPYLCPNGECVNNLLECSITDNNNIQKPTEEIAPYESNNENKQNELDDNATENLDYERLIINEKYYSY